jgi:isoaspartyl peptidase/L-asparaginase-like protein (Ntn-hydrolase superfamily)
MVTPEARRRFERRGSPAARPGTVGAVACDAKGHVAAATSTGGTFGKLPGRIGDSPLISCGTYAEDAGAAVSATGQGEVIIKAGAARRVSESVRSGQTPRRAVREAVKELARMGGWGGLIAIDARGRLGWAWKCERMSFAWMTPSGKGAEA